MSIHTADLPVFLTRKDVANLLRLSPRQVDRLAADGVLAKQKLSASRSGFDRTGVEQHLAKMRGQTASPSDSPSHAVVEGVLAGGFAPNGRGVSGQVYGSPIIIVVVALAKPEARRPLSALVAERERIGDRLPGNPADVWDRCLARSRDELLGLLAYTAAASIDAVQHKGENTASARLTHCRQLIEVLKLDMATWSTPTADGYFNRIRHQQIIAAIDDAKGGHGPALEKLKKSELAVRAEAMIAGTGWLPEPLRPAGNDVLSDMAEQCDAAE